MENYNHHEYFIPFEFSAFRERETLRRYPRFNRLHHGNPVGLCIYRNRARDGGERAGAAPRSLSAAAERYRCYYCAWQGGGMFKVKAVETDVGARMYCPCAEIGFQSQ